MLLFLLPPSFSFRLRPSLSDESVHFSRSICSTQSLHGASLLLKHKLISRSNPQSINHRPYTCSPLHPCLPFPPHLTVIPLSASRLSVDMHLRAHTYVHTHPHTFESRLRCVMAEWAGRLWELEGEKAVREGVKQWRPEASAGWNRAVSREVVRKKREDLYFHATLSYTSLPLWDWAPTEEKCLDCEGYTINEMALLPNTAFHRPHLDSFKQEKGRGR